MCCPLPWLKSSASITNVDCARMEIFPTKRRAMTTPTLLHGLILRARETPLPHHAKSHVSINIAVEAIRGPTSAKTRSSSVLSATFVYSLHGRHNREG